MPAVNWDQPSTGFVSDAAPSLALTNNLGGGIDAVTTGIAIDARSDDAEALRARTKKTMAARIHSEEFFAAFAIAPKSTGIVGVNQAAVPAAAGVNLVDPAAPNALGGIGVAGLSARPAAYGVVGATFTIRSTGVWGTAIGGGVGVRGNGTTGGVQGAATQGHGVAGSTESRNASGVFGFAPGVEGSGVSGTSLGGAGVDGRSTAGPGVRGVSTQAMGVVGESTGSNASGVFGRNDLGSGTGVDGSSQNGIGVRALSSKGTAIDAESFSGIGVDIINYSTSNPALKSYSLGKPGLEVGSGGDAAVRAISYHAGVVAASAGLPKPGNEEAGCGVFGTSVAGAGVCGSTLAGTGVLGVGQPAFGAWAGRFQGNVHIDGLLFKSASLFSIDHPLDPKRKVLNHASVEAPEYKTFYDGVVTLDARGRAVVRLPRWFDALNHELRYQLTPIGAPAAGLHIAREAHGGSFAIAGGAARQKVCWQVTGVRRDRWARANPLQIEQPRKTARSDAPTVAVATVERTARRLQEAVRALAADAKARRKAAERRRAPGRPPAAADAPRAANDRAALKTMKGLRRAAARET